MSNLGAYQDFSINAAANGGVEAYLHQMRRASALRGFGVGVVLVGVTIVVAAQIQEHRATKRWEDVTQRHSERGSHHA